jgi:hypothetical protein
MAATVIVELTGDERRVLEAYRKTEEADRKLRDATGKTGDAADAAGKEFADAWVKAGKGANAGIESLLRQLKRTGSEGQEAAAAIEGHFRETGKSGRKSMETIIEAITGLDAEAGKVAAAAAESIKAEMAEADQQSQFDKTIAELRKIAPAAADAARSVRAGLDDADELTRFDRTIAELRKIDPVAAEEAAKIRTSLEEAAQAADFAATLDALRKLGPEGEATAKAIQADITAAAAASAASFDQVLASVTAVHPEAAETAQRVKREFADAAKQADFKATLDALKRLGPEGEKIARGVAANLDQAAAEAEGSLDEMIGKLRQMDPVAAEVAERLRSELAAADAQTNFDRSLAELRKINPEAAKAASTIREKMDLADAEVKFDGIIAELRKVDPVAAAEAEKLKSKMKEVPEEAEGAWRRFTKSAVAQVGSIAGAYLGVQQAIQQVIAMNRKVIETNKQVFDSLKQTEAGDKRLLQVSESEEDFTKLRDRADELATTFGLGREEARGLMFSARSEGFEDTAGFIAANRQVIDVQSQAAVAGQVPRLFQKEGITGEQVINATLAGAQASRLDFEQIGAALPSAAEGAAMQGATASETIGALSVLASEFKSGDTAADRIKALATAMSLDRGVDNTQEIVSAQAFVDATGGRNVNVDDAAIDDDTRAEFKSVQAKRESSQIRIDELDKKIAEGRGTEKDKFDREQLKKFLEESGKFWENKRQEAEERIQQLTSGQRDSLAGVGLIAGVEKLMSMTEEQRRDFLGNSQEVNVAFSKFSANLDEIKGRQGVITSAMQASGTDQAPVAQARAIAEADPRLAAQRNVAIAQNKLEVEREQKRATEEARRQRQVAENLAEAESQGASPMRIAVAETVSDALAGLGMGGRAEDVIPAITGNKFFNLERDLSAAMTAGDQDAGPALLAARKLREERVNDPTALIPADAALELVRATSNPEAMPADITDDQRRAITAAIVESASQSRNAFLAGFSEQSFLDRFGMESTDRITAAAAPIDSNGEKLDKIAGALEQQNRLMEQQNGLLAQTADNTRPDAPENPDFDAAFNASLQEQDGR